MKTLQFKNNQLAMIYNTLEATVIKIGKAKRGKAKLQKALMEVEKEFQENRKEIIEEYFEQDDKGKLKKDKEGDMVVKSGKDYKEGLEKLKELSEEEFKVNVLTYDKRLKAFYESLEKDDYTVSQDGNFSDVAFDTIMDQLEEVFENNKEKENA